MRCEAIISASSMHFTHLSRLNVLLLTEMFLFKRDENSDRSENNNENENKKKIIFVFIFITMTLEWECNMSVKSCINTTSIK